VGLENAVSVASVLLLAEATLTEKIAVAFRRAGWSRANFEERNAIQAERFPKPAVTVDQQKETMKTIRKDDGSVDGPRIALLVGASIGLGILVHEVFFLVGGAIAVGALTVSTAHALQEHGEHTRPARQHH
jgi:hypothetical protein